MRLRKLYKDSMKPLGLLIILSAFSFLANSQPYGNEWIDFSRNYYKLKVANEGVYKLSDSDLTSAGINLSGIDPQKIQVHYRGEEIPLVVKGESDGIFDSQDYVLFYGLPNDGRMDSALYQVLNYHPHTYYSLFSDTSSYFLSWGASNGKRYKAVNGSVLTGTPESYYYDKTVQLLTEEYFRGEPFSGRAYRSEYNRGEGWFSDRLAKNRTRVFQIDAEGNVSAGPKPYLQTLFFGQGNDPSVSPNHHMRMRIGPNSTNVNQAYLDTSYLGYRTIRYSDSIPISSLGSSSLYLEAAVIDNLNASADNNAIAYFILNYARDFNLRGASSREFSLTGSGSKRLELTNYGKSTPLLLNLSSAEVIHGTLSSGKFECMVNVSGVQDEYILSDSLDFKTAALELVNFTNFNPSANNYQYLIISHPSLSSAADDFESYRSSATGGNYTTLQVYTEQLYDQFFFGQHHPLALKNFLAFLYNQQAIPPEFCLLLGKGYQADLIRDPIPLLNRYEEDLVPSYGIPGSDNYYSFGLGAPSFTPAIRTGRVSARTNINALNYLDKVKTYESTARAEWQKTVFQVSGGQDNNEKIQFGQIVDNFESILEGPKIGARLLRYDKDVSAPVTSDPKKLVINALNDGLLMYNYFGHGSASKIGVDVGKSSEYNNNGKYPLMYFNGCSVGNCFNDESIGEDFLLAPNRGAIVWLANSNLGYVSSLKNWSDLFLEAMADKQYGNSIGDMLRWASSNYTGASFIDVTQKQQIILQGDPAIKIYSSPEADYEISSTDIFLQPSNVTALSDSFIVTAIVKNLGRATNDSLEIELKRTLPNSNEVLLTQKIGPVYNRDTAHFTIFSPDISTRGNNAFKVTLDPMNSLVEVDEMNNSATLNFFMPSNSVNLIYPEKYAIVSRSNVEVVFQNNNLFAGLQNYKYEVDTSHKFDSPWKQSGTLISNSLVKSSVNILPLDSQEYFWRAKIDIPVNEGGVWENASFTYMNGSPRGWNQSHFGQYLGIAHNNTLLDTNSKRFEFVPNQEEFTVKNSRYLTNGSARQIGIRKGVVLLSGGFCGSAGVRVVTIDKVSVSPRPGTCGNGVSSQFDVTKSAGRTDFVNYMRQVKDGDYVMMMTILSGADFLKMDSIPWYIHQLGGDTAMLGALNSPSYAWSFIAQKGNKAFATQDTVFAPNSIADSTCFSQRTIFGRWYEGNWSSELIGPASKWVEFSYQIAPADSQQTDTVSFNIYGVGSNNKDSLLVKNIKANSNSIAFINAKDFPFLRIVSNVKDTLRRTSPQLGRWTVLFDGIPEGSLIIDNSYVFNSDTLNGGDSVKLGVVFQNISAYSFADSIEAEIILVDESRNEKSISKIKLANLNPGDQDYIELNYNSLGLNGKNKIKLFVNPEYTQPELFLFNNTLNKDFIIKKDPFNPILDVTFEGRHIFDGDIVSPSPNILIQIKDNSPLIDFADTSNFVIRIKRSSDLNYKRVFFGDPGGILEILSSNGDERAEALYKPKNLNDGTYDLSVEVTDISGNSSGVRPYTISFKVINESSVTNFYPYPNPFSTRMSFVYTLTGSIIPENIEIEIYTVSGKLVKEIKKADLEPIFIGNNISDYKWDGTDQYGDKLANGVYFYRVTVKDNNSILKRSSREIDRNEDRFFKNNTGKIYLMR